MATVQSTDTSARTVGRRRDGIGRKPPALPTRVARRLGSRRVLGFLLAALLVYLVVLPVFFLIYGSLFDGPPGSSASFSLKHYQEILTDAGTYRILASSFQYAAGSSVVSFIIGTTLAWFLVRTDIPGKGMFTFVGLFPIAMPLILEAVSWTLLLDPESGAANELLRAWHLSWLTINVDSMLGMIIVGGFANMPLVWLWMTPAFGAMDPSLEEAAAASGSSRLRTIRTVTLPVLLPALAATFLINIILAIEDLVVPIVIGLPSRVHVLATAVFLSYSTVPIDVPAASVYGVMLLTITVALVLVYRALTARGERFAIVRGRGYRPVTIRLGWTRWPWFIAMCIILTVTAVLPVLMLIWASLTPYLEPPSLAALRSLSLRWYKELGSDPMATRGLVNTAVLGVVTAVVVLALSVALGWYIVRTKGRLRAVLDVLSFAPIAIPGLVLGVSLIWLYLTLPIPIYGTIFVLGVAYVTRFIPYGVRLVYSGLSQFHAELEEAAYVAGSRWSRVMRTVTVPLLGPTLLASGIYTILRVFQELGASLFLTSFGNEPYSVVAYNLWQGGQTGKTAAYGVVAVVIVSCLVIIARVVGKGRQMFE